MPERYRFSVFVPRRIHEDTLSCHPGASPPYSSTHPRKHPRQNEGQYDEIGGLRREYPRSSFWDSVTNWDPERSSASCVEWEAWPFDRDLRCRCRRIPPAQPGVDKVAEWFCQVWICHIRIRQHPRVCHRLPHRRRRCGPLELYRQPGSRIRLERENA